MERIGYSSAQECVPLCSLLKSRKAHSGFYERKKTVFVPFFSLSPPMFTVPLLSNQSHLEVSVLTLQNGLGIFITDYLVQIPCEMGLACFST